MTLNDADRYSRFIIRQNCTEFAVKYDWMSVVALSYHSLATNGSRIYFFIYGFFRPGDSTWIGAPVRTTAFDCLVADGNPVGRFLGLLDLPLHLRTTVRPLPQVSSTSDINMGQLSHFTPQTQKRTI